MFLLYAETSLRIVWLNKSVIVSFLPFNIFHDQYLDKECSWYEVFVGSIIRSSVFFSLWNVLMVLVFYIFIIRILLKQIVMSPSIILTPIVQTILRVAYTFFFLLKRCHHLFLSDMEEKKCGLMFFSLHSSDV